MKPTRPNRISIFPSRRTIGWLSTLPYLFLVIGPLLALLFVLVPRLASGIDWIPLLLPRGRRLALLLRSLGLALAVSFSGVFLGIAAGAILWRWRTGLASGLRWFLLVMAPLPAYLHALGWSAFVVMINQIFTSIGVPAIIFRGWLASWWVQLLSLFPLAIAFALIGFESVDAGMIDAARLYGPDFHAFKKIILPLAAPFLFAGGAFLFLFSLIDYSVPSLFQVSTYSLEIFADFSASLDSGRAFLLAAPVMTITLIAIVLGQSALRDAALRPPWKADTWAVPPAWPSWFRTMGQFALILLLAQILVPLLSQILLAGSLSDILSTTRAAQDEIGTTWWVASLAAAASLLISLPVAQRIAENSKRRSIWWALTLLPLAIPSPIIGVALITLWNRPATQMIYTSLAMPVFAAIARFAPIGVILLLAMHRRRDPTLIEAARIFQKNDLQTWIRVRLPLIIPGLLATGAVVFVLSAGELGATVLVTPPGYATLTLRIYNFLHYGASDTVAGLGLAMTFAAVLFGAAAVLILFGWSRLGRRRAS